MVLCLDNLPSAISLAALSIFRDMRRQHTFTEFHSELRWRVSFLSLSLCSSMVVAYLEETELVW